ncbi:MAG TPA: hypothetical protein VJT73_11760, partial [Polyangiaceae bacterium]|nr:hypothetical protein [Polyangiaceae bacterium]
HPGFEQPAPTASVLAATSDAAGKIEMKWPTSPPAIERVEARQRNSHETLDLLHVRTRPVDFRKEHLLVR